MPANIEVGRAADAHLPAVRYHEGLALETLGRPDEARAAFRAAAEGPVRLAEGHYWVGQSLEKLDDEAEARAHFERLARTQPEAVDETVSFERRMAAREQRANAFFLRALGLYGVGRLDDARIALRKCRDLDPDHLGAAAFQRSLPGPEPRPSGPVRRRREATR